MEPAGTETVSDLKIGRETSMARSHGHSKRSRDCKFDDDTKPNNLDSQKDKHVAEIQPNPRQRRKMVETASNSDSTLTNGIHSSTSDNESSCPAARPAETSHSRCRGSSLSPSRMSSSNQCSPTETHQLRLDCSILSKPPMSDGSCGSGSAMSDGVNTISPGGTLPGFARQAVPHSSDPQVIDELPALIGVCAPGSPHMSASNVHCSSDPQVDKSTKNICITLYTQIFYRAVHQEICLARSSITDILLSLFLSIH